MGPETATTGLFVQGVERMAEPRFEVRTGLLSRKITSDRYSLAENAGIPATRGTRLEMSLQRLTVLGGHEIVPEIGVPLQEVRARHEFSKLLDEDPDTATGNLPGRPS
jgi:hypothetical protein